MEQMCLSLTLRTKSEIGVNIREEKCNSPAKYNNILVCRLYLIIVIMELITKDKKTSKV